MSYRATRALALLIAIFAVFAATFAGARLAAATGLNSTASATGHSVSPAMPTGTPMPVCGLGWNMVVNNDDDGQLNSIAAISANDVWAVGSRPNEYGSGAVVMQWNGLNWSDVPAPYFEASTELSSITAISSDDIWTVGQSNNHPLILHWDGIQWAIMPAITAMQGGALLAVDAIATDNVWAVGWHYDGGTRQPLVVRWDGMNWNTITSPSAGPDGSFTAVSARIRDEVWAVGYYGSPRQTLIERWDGARWLIVTSPNAAGFGNNELHGVADISDNNVWSVGYYSNPATGSMQALTLHWDGNQWNTVPNPAMGSNTPGFLYGITAIDANDIWAVGGISGDAGPNMTLHWDGTDWNAAVTPRFTGGDQFLAAVSAISSGDVWAAGHYAGDMPCGEMAMRFYDHCAVAGAMVSHVFWQGPPSQPSPLQQLPITITVGLGTSQIEYRAQMTTATGNFTLSMGTLAPGTYNWRASGPKYLANSGYATLRSGQENYLEIGMMQVGDANEDNMVNVSDFDIVKMKFGKRVGDPGYDARADFDRNDMVNICDFLYLKKNFGHAGAPPID